MDQTSAEASCLTYIHADVSALRFDDVIVFGTGQGWRLGQCEVRYKWGLILTNVALACYLMLVLLFFYSLTSALSAGIIIILISYFNFNFPLHLHLHLYLRCRQKARTAGKEAEDWFTEYLNKKDVDPDKRYGTTPPVFSTLTRAPSTGYRV